MMSSQFPHRGAAQDSPVEEHHHYHHHHQHHHQFKWSAKWEFKQQCHRPGQEQGGRHPHLHLCPLDLLYWQVPSFPSLFAHSHRSLCSEFTVLNQTILLTILDNLCKFLQFFDNNFCLQFWPFDNKKITISTIFDNFDKFWQSWQLQLVDFCEHEDISDN